MGSGNWIVDNLNSALATWNEKLTEIWTLISTSPEEFKGGGIWDVILNIHDALRAIGYALLVLFFVAGVVKTCGSFTELKRPEVAVKTFVRFALAQGAVTYGLELMMTLFSIAQGAVSTIMDASGLTAMSDTALPDEMVAIIEGRDPALVEDAYASTRQSEKKKPLPGDIEPPAKNIHIVSEEIKPPIPLDEGDAGQNGPADSGEQPGEETPESSAAEEPNAPTDSASVPENHEPSSEDETKE